MKEEGARLEERPRWMADFTQESTPTSSLELTLGLRTANHYGENRQSQAHHGEGAAFNNKNNSNEDTGDFECLDQHQDDLWAVSPQGSFPSPGR